MSDIGTTYSIEARSLNIAGVASHNFLVLRNDATGEAVAELHGLATDRKTGKAVPMGFNSDAYSLRIHHLVHDGQYASEISAPLAPVTYINSNQNFQQLSIGSPDEMLARWNKAVSAMERLNGYDLDYPVGGISLFGPTVNSNSAYRTLAQIMGVFVYDFPGVIEPGLDNEMLPENHSTSIIDPDSDLATNPDPLVKTIHYVDPLILDLDGDGLEITALSQGVLFDINGDSRKTGTAWAGADDGLLVWDRDGNGSIDTGAELFGDQTVLSNGEYAEHGFAALQDLDTGSWVDGALVGAGDGKFDASDAHYADVRVWQDVNQDGVSQADELKTLAELGIESIALASTATTTGYGDAQLVQSGSFTRTDGSTGEAGSFNLAQNNFVRAFAPITVSEAA